MSDVVHTKGPFIDLHAHLDGSITADIARKLADMQNIDIPWDDTQLVDMLSVPESCESLNDFLKCFEFPLTLLQTKRGISEAVYLVLESMEKTGTVYAEIRFAPALHTREGLTQEEVIEAALEGLNRAHIFSNLILCCMRGQGNEDDNRLTVELARKFLVRNRGVVAVDLAGAEALYPTDSYRQLFAMVKEYGIPFTIHAGEAAGPESVKAAIEMGTVRIGHGVRAVYDNNILNLIKEKGIVLEMCPTSNRQTRAVEDMSKYPLVKYLDMGIKVTINTDDCAIERTDISREFEYIRSAYGITRQQEDTLYYNAVDGAFTDEETKNKLRKLILQ